MKRFVVGADRGQSMLLPECLDDFIAESNPDRVIDAFVDALDLAELGFDGVEPAATDRPAYRGLAVRLLADQKGAFEAIAAAQNDLFVGRFGLAMSKRDGCWGR